MTDNMPKGKENESSTVNIVSRSHWNAMEPRSKDKMQGLAQQVIIHHTALWSCRQSQEYISQLTYIQKMHVEERGFEDIGYNFLLGQDGTVYEGRGWGIVGAHAKNHNLNSIGIAFMGNFNDYSPSSSALSAAQILIRCGVAQGFLNPNFVILGHRDIANTECPGEYLYSSLATLRYQ
ncbi:peptidoglycan recognition protein 5 [Electrophorus electricus]|uniref:Peptidoglycan-recognition protein n=1 Tax=Electrophorus electricus TaxID=8005 RepID=A0A4W4G2Q3_ELEEL|nr:peptidoglycan recognition protein 5 [Electrophorus electricus]